MARIQQLDEKTINQIAAGEVVESPSSVMKELVENAVDAGAKHIRIEASSGGFHTLKIIDDGIGMDLEDLKLCLLRHATSKIQSIEDLAQVSTLGFRGEALASIAAVSRLKITTSAEGSKEAYQLVSDEVEVRIHPSARSKGTTIEVNDLFYNVPARKSFQKSAGASSGDLTRWVGYLALAYPHVGFTYLYQGKEMFSSVQQAQDQANWQIDPWKLVCGKIFGEAFAQQGLDIDQTHQSWKIKGFLGHPHDHRPNRMGQIWIVNGRVVTIPQLSRAVQEGYGPRLPVGRFPQFVLHLTLPGEWIDVNVHPQKRELRFKDSGMIGSWIAHAVGLRLARSSSPNQPASFGAFERPWENSLGQESINDRSESTGSSPFTPLCEKEEVPLKSSFTSFSASAPWEPSPASSISVNAPYVHKTQSLDFDLHLTPLTIWKRWSLWRVDQLEAKLEGLQVALGKGQSAVDLVWMSGPRALSRIRYEQAISKQSHVLSQALLMPIQFDVHLGQMEKYQLLLPSLQACGFELRQIDRLSLAIDAIPSGMDPDSVQAFLHELLEGESPSVKALTKEKMALSLARQIERYESQIKIAPSDLVLGLARCQEKFFSPLGRAIFRPLREEDFEVKSFKVGVK